jgi:HD-GYP domain-containing protein (c-di-GMP phosphodiesterase class II)
MGAVAKVDGLEQEALALAQRPNIHCIDQLIEAAPVRDLVASEDIRDDKGRVLWTQGQPITSEIRERLMARRLAQPLESTLAFRDGLTAIELADAARALLAECEPLARLVGANAQQVLALFGRVRLAGAPGTMLSTLAINDRYAMRHALATGIAAASLASMLGRSESIMLDALQAGLMRDLGELYLDPTLKGDNRRLNFDQWRSTCVHPIVSAALLRDAGVYSEHAILAIREHHERLDGTGFPGSLIEHRISPLGRLLFTADMLAGVLISGRHAELRSQLALRLIPGQFPRDVMVLASERLRVRTSDLQIEVDLPKLEKIASDVLQGLQRSRKEAALLEGLPNLSESERRLAARLRLQSVQFEMALHASGAVTALGSHENALASDPEIVSELYLVVREMSWRLPGLRRHVELAVRGHASDPAYWSGLLNALRIDIDPAAFAAI